MKEPDCQYHKIMGEIKHLERTIPMYVFIGGVAAVNGAKGIVNGSLEGDTFQQVSYYLSMFSLASPLLLTGPIKGSLGELRYLKKKISEYKR